MGCVPPDAGLSRRTAPHHRTTWSASDLRRSDDRLSPGPAGARRQLYNVKPDLTTLGKIIGGGLAIAAYGGRAGHHEESCAARVRCTKRVLSPGIRWRSRRASPCCSTRRIIRKRTTRWNSILAELTANVPAGMWWNRVGSMHTFFFHTGPVTELRGRQDARTGGDSDVFSSLLDRGVYFPPSQFEAAFVSAAHTPEDIAYTRQAIREFF